MAQRHRLSPDEVFGLLVDRRRRYVLHYLRIAGDDVIEFDPLIDWVLEQIDDPDWSGEDSRGRLETSLHHVHLPQMEAIGVVEYDWRSRTIRYRECYELEAHLEQVADSDLS